MLTARIHAMQEGFVEITERVEARVVEGLDLAAATAAEVAQAGATIDLELEVVPAHESVDGYSAGIKSRRVTTSNPGRTTPLARFFDEGTLGKRTKKLKGPRKESWVVKGKGGEYTSRRQDVADKGIKPQRFFGKARAAGRAKLVERIHEPF
jgi:hypothetical protein